MHLLSVLPLASVLASQLKPERKDPVDLFRHPLPKRGPVAQSLLIIIAIYVGRI